MTPLCWSKHSIGRGDDIVCLRNSGGKETILRISSVWLSTNNEYVNTSNEIIVGFSTHSERPPCILRPGLSEPHNSDNSNSSSSSDFDQPMSINASRSIYEALIGWPAFPILKDRERCSLDGSARLNSFWFHHYCFFWDHGIRWDESKRWDSSSTCPALQEDFA